MYTTIKRYKLEPGDFIEIKLKLYADDTQRFISSEELIVETFKTLKINENASDARIDMKMTVGIIKAVAQKIHKH